MYIVHITELCKEVENVFSKRLIVIPLTLLWPTRMQSLPCKGKMCSTQAENAHCYNHTEAMLLSLVISPHY